MITMNELVDLRMQQHIAHEIYRQQIMQRIPDPFPPMLPIPMPRHVIMPPRVSLPGVEATLQNDDLWKQFHQIGTEMIITKSGRRMFPSMRLSLSGLEDESNYCVLLEMVPIGDCRFKFSGSQWVPAGGAEPQSPQRMYLHPDSPATGAHWQAQPILFNKVKLTNNTLDNNGHVVLASMHKYQPRLHVIRTSDLTQIPWAPQQAFVFPETEFVAVTAYQNDRITKLKIDNNPFAKGFRETGQSRCKRKMSSSPPLHEDQDQNQHQQSFNDMSHTNSTTKSDVDATTASTICTDKSSQQQQRLLNDLDDGPRTKRIRSNGSACSITSFEDIVVSGDYCSGNSSSGTSSPNDVLLANENAKQELTAPGITAATSLQTNNAHLEGGVGTLPTSVSFMHHFQQNMQSLLRPSLVDLACSYFGRPQPLYPQQQSHNIYANAAAAAAFVGPSHHHHHHHQQHAGFNDSIAMQLQDHLPHPTMDISNAASNSTNHTHITDSMLLPSLSCIPTAVTSETLSLSPPVEATLTRSPPKKKGFSISAILDSNS